MFGGRHIIVTILHLCDNRLIIKFMRIAGIGFSTIGKSINSSLNHSVSVEVVSRAVSSASMVDFVSIVYLQYLQEKAPTT
jgi:hypothetical protein